jgi:hypothetical protein
MGLSESRHTISRGLALIVFCWIGAYQVFFAWLHDIDASVGFATVCSLGLVAWAFMQAGDQKPASKDWPN